MALWVMRCAARPWSDSPMPHCTRQPGHSGEHWHQGLWAWFAWWHAAEYDKAGVWHDPLWRTPRRLAGEN